VFDLSQILVLYNKDVPAHAMKTFGAAVDGGKWSASLLSNFTPQENRSWYPLNKRLGGWNIICFS
jgi:hypothetical protein